MKANIFFLFNFFFLNLNVTSDRRRREVSSAVSELFTRLVIDGRLLIGLFSNCQVDS